MSFFIPSDTIAAIATAPGTGAVAIVRVSGPDTFPVIDRLFHCPAPPPSERPGGTFIHGRVHAPDSDALLDEALLLIFKAPHSYTGENSVEIQCHGGSVIAQLILDALISTGIRHADPGEFTKRAFLNDKLDLTQAEAVLELIHARSERAAQLATAQLEDHLGTKIRQLYEKLLALTADTEAMLDFPDDELPQEVPNAISDRLTAVSNDIQALLGTWNEGRILRDGAKIVIAGAPNAGKSTLLNRLAGRDRAIVSPTPGTTRDVIEEYISLKGYPVQLLDTAGLRDSDCDIEGEGVKRTHKALSEADLCLYVVDLSIPVPEEEQRFIHSKNTENLIILGNKSDLKAVLEQNDFKNHDFIAISAKNDADFDVLIDKILKKLLQKQTLPDGNVAVSERHKTALLEAKNELFAACGALKTGSEIEFLPAATHLRAATDQIGYIFGKNCTEDMLDTIFSRFCVGK